MLILIRFVNDSTKEKIKSKISEVEEELFGTYRLILERASHGLYHTLFVNLQQFGFKFLKFF